MERKPKDQSSKLIWTIWKCWSWIFAIICTTFYLLLHSLIQFSRVKEILNRAVQLICVAFRYSPNVTRLKDQLEFWVTCENTWNSSTQHTLLVQMQLNNRRRKFCTKPLTGWHVMKHNLRMIIITFLNDEKQLKIWYNSTLTIFVIILERHIFRMYADYVYNVHYLDIWRWIWHGQMKTYWSITHILFPIWCQ